MLFHVTKNALELGQWLTSPGDSQEVRQSLKDLNRWAVENLLNRSSSREADWPSRIGGWYAADSKGFCGLYADTQQKVLPKHIQELPWHFYRVKMKAPRRCPMVLVDHCRRLLSAGGAADKAADHYLNPDDGWKIYESVGSLMYAIEEVDAPGLEVCGAHFQYETDSLRAKRMFPLP